MPQPLLYRGYWYDEQLGWYWLGVRAYDPLLKHFPQPDPSEQDGVLSYSYCHNDPVDCSDPSGLAGNGEELGPVPVADTVGVAQDAVPGSSELSPVVDDAALPGAPPPDGEAGIDPQAESVTAQAATGTVSSADIPTTPGVYRWVGEIDGQEVTVRTGKASNLQSRANQYLNQSRTVLNTRIRALMARWESGDRSISNPYYRSGNYTFEAIYRVEIADPVVLHDTLAGLEEHVYELYDGSDAIFNGPNRPFSTDRKFVQMNRYRAAARTWLQENGDEVFWFDR